MAKILRYRQEAREALGRGIRKFARAIDGTIGPKGGNGIIDVPLGTPIVTRDGDQIASEIELDDPFENMGVQVVRQAANQTNEVAGDGTTTATILADAIVQEGLKSIAGGANPVDVVRGIERAGSLAYDEIREQAVPLPDGGAVAVASVAAGDRDLGELVGEALLRVGESGIVDVERSQAIRTTVEIATGFTFDRGYISHHLATETDTLEAILSQTRILLTDATVNGQQQLKMILDKVGTDEPLLIISDGFDAEAKAALLGLRDTDAAPVVAVNPPEFGRWREAMMEDLAILTGGRYINATMGRSLENLTPEDLGFADSVTTNEEKTLIVGAAGNAEEIEGRREQVARKLEVMEQPMERDKLEERLAQLKSGGGKATIYVGGYTDVERRRREMLIEDAVNAAQHAIAEGVVPGGGMALVNAAKEIEDYRGGSVGDQLKGFNALSDALVQPLRCIADNCGADIKTVVSTARQQTAGHGFNAETGSFEDLVGQGVIDPVKVTCTALENAVSVASLILTTRVLIADKPEFDDPTAGPALGGGSEDYAVALDDS